MFRLLLLAMLLAIGWVCIEAHWQPEQLELTLRMRRPDELSAVASEGARGFGGWLVRWWASAQEAEEKKAAEEITWQDRQELDKLVREKTQSDEK